MPHQNPINYNIYGGNIFCAKRDYDLSFYSLKRPSIIKEDNNGTQIEDAECPSTYKLCGNKDQGFEYLTCILEDKDCPVNNLKFISEVNVSTNIT